MSISPTIAACLCFKTDGICTAYKLFYTNLKTIETRLISNCGEFAIIKIGIVEILPNPQVLPKSLSALK